jgi:FkbM family methyltransferase
VDLRSLAKNARVAWQRRASANDFVRRLAWLYSHRLPLALRPQTWTIAFRYPAPLGFVRLCVRSNHGADAFIHSEVFDQQCYRLPLDRAPATILDLGANIGLSAIYFARLFPRAELACVEPAPDNLRVLEKNLKLNAVGARVIPAAVDVDDGRTLLELDERDYGHRVVVQSPAVSRAALEVDAISVPTILGRLSWKRVGLLKVDIEGHEAVLFARDCGWLDRVDALCIEWHVDGGAERLAALANRFGFAEPSRLPGNIWLLIRQHRGAEASAAPC